MIASWTRAIPVMATALLVGACASDQLPISPEANGTNVAAALETEESPGAELQVEDHGEVALLPPLPARKRQRMNLDQLGAAIQQVTGGLSWKEGNVDMLTSLSATLGKPDYREVIVEDLNPSPIFQKFLGDAASSVCQEMIQREIEDPYAERHLLIHVEPDDDLDQLAEGLDANLIELQRRFHGKAMTSETPEMVHWRWLVTSIATGTQDPNRGWRAACVALMTHPEFYTY